MKTSHKTLGILGGMGPYATTMFMNNIMDLTPAKKDWEHVRMIVDNNPHIPSRSRALLYQETSPVSAMIESCEKLQTYPVDFIAIPCNSACFWIDEVRKKVKVPVLNILEIASKALIRKNDQIKNVLVLGGAVTAQKRIYHRHLEPFGATQIILPEDDEQKVIQFFYGAVLWDLYSFTSAAAKSNYFRELR